MKAAMNSPTRFNNNPILFSTFEYNNDTKQMLLSYMRSVEPSSAGGYVEDCFSKDYSTDIPDMGYEDEEYFWSEQDMFFIEKYNLAVDIDFLEHVKNKMHRLVS